ncbi:MAG: carbon-nitrogen hydrolase family protein [Enterobacter sichuanensis]|uniref:Carbon-nitrogen hydrolase family protein n=1 Tax=Enterobacter cloacae TaxID=550 RepID=A0AB37VKI1_ENTCL|nr:MULTISPECIES: carbon-nitrogen hydrolase family protein [Enterobacter cloacae complex]MBY6355012.1 carbon-nitrogen hydrolase family protein [Enterobacter sichuanensis]MDU5195787.1 carbon-nitrogen hydrolase family protein [Enterobacter sichuanensis]MDU5348353.1 carbon-nitrogen hydrolase family protein [Enterobacter sichuanensis]MDU5388404.1 carbon-nitrogen hydrolase family protein [Enterobacter sichuanensis]RWT81124.1 carbon-nitrogen hydrolase family protein [Enterobacter cloacae]
MSHWNIAAAQYGGQHQSIDDHVTHHLRFIAEAARQRCDLLVFPELSLTGSGMSTLPPPPGDAQLDPLLDAAHFYRITVIAGLPVERNGLRQKGLALFTPSRQRALRYPQGSGASLMPGDKHLSIMDAHADSPNLDPSATLFTSCQSVRDYRWRQSISTLQRFAHKYAIAVLMANAGSGSALWDDKGQLIVRADNGELLLTGSLGRQGWQGDIIPLG